ncbi:UDP-N-acetylmuramate dehydrogenase [endosymbiont of unidentified scaly snail isolate Monju]|nr:UDP-N-acetylmuramate dehydrogenase [endosymbiont of unidentified scaly snail isolate Monju]BAN68404.1 UDP-N-acetylmuramate dehydrogenase [endosymbiont of unidentified scaly snail isolate Monju]
MMAARQNTPWRGELRFDEPLARHTSWRVGGAARRFYRPADAEDLAAFLRELPADEPLLWLGLGSNLLVRDGGFAGTVIALKGRLDTIDIDGDVLHAGAGASCARAARQAARAGLTGAAFLAGIPGTLGGALAMNAGAFGGEIWPVVRAVRTVDRAGILRRRLPADYRVGYREVTGPAGEWFVGVELQLRSGDVAAEQAAIRGLLERRAATQPTGLPSAGSTFRNPPGDHAARLIEAAGLKGYRIGGAEVSPKHANFLINTGEATAADIEALIAHVRDEVERRFGVRLQTEVHIVGEPT